MIFNRKLEEACIVDVGNGNCFTVPREVSEYINSLKKESIELRYKTKCLEEELKVIKPMVAEATFKQAMTTDCINCKYVAISSWDDRILCCMKDNVCEDFMPSKGEKDD